MEQLPEIAGLEGFTDHDLSLDNDTPPDAIIVWFDVVKEYMPALSEAAGERVYKNFIHRFYIKELGFSQGSRRIKDDVYFSEKENQWKVKRLAGPGQSDIKKFINAWNRFQKGNNAVIEGTPIEMMFKHDPTRADMYCRNQITTIERLAALGDADCQRGGMGWRDDRDRAKGFLAKVKENAGSVQNFAKMNQLEADNLRLTAEIAELSSKLTILLNAQIEAAEKANLSEPVKKTAKASKGNRRRHPQEAAVTETNVEGIEGIE